MSCRQPDRDRMSKSAQPIQTDAPIAIRTRSKVHQQDTASKCMVANEAPYQSQLAMETKEQFLQLNKQSDERHVEICSKIQLIYNQQTLLSEQHSSMILELRMELAALRVQLESKDAAIDQLVKPKQNEKLATHSKSTIKQIGQIHQDAPIRSEGPEFNSRSAGTSDIANASKVTKIQGNHDSIGPDKFMPSTTETNERTVQVSLSSLPSITRIQLIRPDRPKLPSTTNRAQRRGDKLPLRTTNNPDKLHSSSDNYAGAAIVPSVNFTHLCSRHGFNTSRRSFRS